MDRATAETKAQALFDTLKLKQEAYYALKGRYWQGLAHGQRTHDYNEGWADMAVTRPTDVSAAVNVYRAPQGWGWELAVTIVDGSNTYHRCINHGPETWRAHRWQEVQKDAT